MPEKRKILFVCTGNIFRSFIAERVLKHLLEERRMNDTIVRSAGTEAFPQEMYPEVIRGLDRLGVDCRGHTQRRLTASDLESHDLVVAMAESHVDYLNKQFGFEEAVLFNEIANGERSSVADVEDVISDYSSQPKKVDAHVRKTIKHLSDSMPRFLEQALGRYLLFSDFVTRRKKENRGFPLIPLYETALSMAFMSSAIPEKEDGHVLVVPKKRYAKFESIPREVRTDMMEAVAMIGKAMAKSHGGYNILLNNGSDAGQYIFHSHVHVIPRRKNDAIAIELWKDRKYTKAEHRAFNLRLKRAIERVRGA